MSTPRPAVFRLRTLMLATALAAVGFWLLRLADGVQLVLGGWALGVLSVPFLIHRDRPDPPRRADLLLFPAATAAAVAAEVAAARLAYYTMGEIMEALYFFTISLNLAPLVLLTAGRRRLAYGWVLALALCLVPYQLALLAKWRVVAREANNVIAYVNAFRATTGAYPADLRGYAPGRPIPRDWIVYAPDPRDGFMVGYHLGAWETMHTYRPATGWTYYPD